MSQSTLAAPAQLAAQLDRQPAIAELAQLDQWVISKYVPKNGKLDKPPFSPLLDAKHTKPWQCSHSNPAHWAGYDAAFSTLTHYRFLWMGFVFHESDPYSGVDLDGCCKPECERIRTRDDIEDWALRIIDLVSSYTEISPSGKGVKIFARGTIAESLKHSMGEHVGIEIYSKQRYFTVTGAHLAGTPSNICEAQAALDQLDREYRPARPAPQPAAQQARAIISLTPRQQSSGRASLDDVKAEFNAKNQLPDLLAGYGAVQTSSKDYTCPFCKHSHTNTLFIYNERVYSRSPGCIVPQKRGLDSFGLYCLVDHNNDPVAAAKKLNPIAPRKRRQEAPPAVEQPARKQTPEQAADAERKRAQRTQQAAETRAAVELAASQDARLSDSAQLVLMALLDVAGDRAWCRPSVARIEEMTSLCRRAVFYGLAELERREYIRSSDAPGRTTVRTFLRMQAPAPVLGALHPDLNIQDLPTLTRGASEGAPQLPAPEPLAEWEFWQPADSECSGYDVDLEAAPAVELEQPALVELPAGWRIVRPARGPWCWAAAEGAMTATHPRDTSDQVLIAAAWAKAAALAEVRAVEPAQPEPTPAPATVAHQEAPAGPGASYSPPPVEPSGEYTARVKDLLDFSEQWAAATSAIKVRADVADVADLEIEQQQLAGPPVHKPSKSGKVTGLDRYRADVALMSDTQLAGEIKKHKRTIDKHPGAFWLKDVRAKLDLVQAELDQRDGEQPQARPSAPARASVVDARPSQARRAAGPPPNPFRGQQASLFGGAD